jgi:hypothetical protein
MGDRHSRGGDWLAGHIKSRRPSYCEGWMGALAQFQVRNGTWNMENEKGLARSRITRVREGWSWLSRAWDGMGWDGSDRMGLTEKQPGSSVRGPDTVTDSMAA